jgi:hypothetical protein
LGLDIYNALEATPKNHGTIPTFLCVAKSWHLVKESEKKELLQLVQRILFFNDPKTPYFEEK